MSSEVRSPKTSLHHVSSLSQSSGVLNSEHNRDSVLCYLLLLLSC